jgi:hypothetical protein
MASLACGASAAHAVMSGLSDGAVTRLTPFGEHIQSAGASLRLRSERNLTFSILCQ